jgi:hypothetical protein
MSIEGMDVKQRVMDLRDDLSANGKKLEKKYPVAIEYMEEFVGLYLQGHPELISLPTETLWGLVTQYMNVLEELKSNDAESQENAGVI